MATVLDVARYILEQRGPMTAMKLQKLCYYSQAWSLVWDDKPLFDDVIEAWANGPVSPRLYDQHRSMFSVGKDSIKGDASALSRIQRETVDAVLTHYGDKSPQWLSDLTHSEDPWTDARDGLKPGERGDNEISHAAMVEYYGAL